MRPRPRQSEIRPKVSTLPRQKTEAAAYLSIYKLTVEKKRLQQELESLDQRRDRIQKRLELLENQVAQLENGAHELRDQSPIAAKAAPIPQSEATQAGTFDMVFLEY